MSSQAAVGSDVTEAHIFDALSHDRRRHLLPILLESEPPIQVSTLATRLARREQAARPDEVGASPDDQVIRQRPDPDTVDQLKIVLHHRHLPRLADAGLIEYESDAKRVTPTPVVSEVVAALNALSPRVERARP